MRKLAKLALLTGIGLVSSWLAGCEELAPTPEAPLVWEESLSVAATKALSEDKNILINFTGSDWCGWCVRLRREVFQRSAFAEYATNKLILVEIDFPRGKAQTTERKKANEALADKFQIESFPTVVLLSPSGRLLGRTGYVEGGPGAFLGHLQRISHAKGSGSAETSPQAGLLGLKLKGISGTGEGRMALINNTTLRTGESGLVRAGDQRLQVRCLSIRDNSVLVAIGEDGTPRELRLSGRL